MALRPAILGGALLLGACSSGGGADQNAQAPDAAASNAQSVPCALAGSRSFTANCAAEKVTSGARTIVTVRHPNGGFRRLVELEGGRRFAAADGSDEVHIERNGAEIEVTLGDDHYLFPAPADAPAK
jgi:hypothetical protein